MEFGTVIKMKLYPPPKKLKFPQYRLTLTLDKYLTVNEPCASFIDAQKLIYEWFKAELPVQEVMLAVCLDGQNRVIGNIPVARGGGHGMSMTPSDIFRPVITAGASAFILAHNHPSGNPTPSQEDIVFTQKIIEAGKILGIWMLDHLVITMDNKAVSLIDYVDFQ